MENESLLQWQDPLLHNIEFAGAFLGVINDVGYILPRL